MVILLVAQGDLLRLFFCQFLAVTPAVASCSVRSIVVWTVL